MECPICKVVIKHVKLHLSKTIKCSNNIDMDHFVMIFDEFTKQRKREKDRIKTQNMRKRKREESKESYLEEKEKNTERNRNFRE